MIKNMLRITEHSTIASTSRTCYNHACIPCFYIDNNKTSLYDYVTIHSNTFDKSLTDFGLKMVINDRIKTSFYFSIK